MLTWRPATLNDVHMVFSDLSDVSSQEYLEIFPGVDKDWWTLLRPLGKLINLTGAHTEALVDETGQALAVFGHNPSDTPKVRTTWFAFSKAYQARGAASTRACRKLLKQYQVFFPGTSFHSYTRSRHPWRDRWLKVLGYRFVGLTADGAYEFVFVPCSDKADDVDAVG